MLSGRAVPETRDETVEWLAAALSRFSAGGSIPPELATSLDEALREPGRREALLRTLRLRVAQHSAGRVSLSTADPAEFTALPRSPLVVPLRVSGFRRLILAPAAEPVLFDD